MGPSIIQFIALMLMLLVIGIFWGPWVALHRSLHLFSKEELIKITKILAVNLGRLMQITMPLCLLTMFLSIIFFPEKGRIEFYLIIASFACMVITLIVTMTTELPLVNKIKSWKVDALPSDWEAIRNKWVKFHAFRVFPGLIGFALYLLANPPYYQIVRRGQNPLYTPGP